MEETMKKKSMIVAVLMASMVLGACGNKAETSATEDAVVSEAPTEEATTLEPEETTENTEQSAGEAQTDSSSSSESASTGSNSTTGTKGSTSSDKNSGNATASSTTTGSSSAKQSTSSGSESKQSESGSQDSAQTTGVQTKYQMYAGTYFDEVVYTFADDDVEGKPYCEINVSNVTATSFDFTIYDVDGANRSLKFKTHTAVFTGDGTQAEYNGKGYHLVFTFPDDRGALPDVVCMQVSGLKDMGGCMYVNNDVPGHEFG